MQKHIKTTLPLLIRLITGFTWHNIAQVGTESVPVIIGETPAANYIFETIDVLGVDFLVETSRIHAPR